MTVIRFGFEVFRGICFWFFPPLVLLLTVTRYEVGEVEIEFPDGDVDVIGIHAQTGLRTFRRLLEPLPIRRLQRNCLEEDHHHEVQSPDLGFKKKQR